MVAAFRVLGWLEGVSMIILMFIAMPLKYIYAIPEATQIVGLVHGILFIAYVLFAMRVAQVLKWPMDTLMRAFVGAIFPFGTFIFNRKYL